MASNEFAGHRSGVGDALYLLKRLGLSGAKNYAKRGADARWKAVLDVLGQLDARQTRQSNVARLQRMMLQRANMPSAVDSKENVK